MPAKKKSKSKPKTLYALLCSWRNDSDMTVTEAKRLRAVLGKESPGLLFRIVPAPAKAKGKR